MLHCVRLCSGIHWLLWYKIFFSCQLRLFNPSDSFIFPEQIDPLLSLSCNVILMYSTLFIIITRIKFGRCIRLYEVFNQKVDACFDVWIYLECCSFLIACINGNVGPKFSSNIVTLHGANIDLNETAADHHKIMDRPTYFIHERNKSIHPQFWFHNWNRSRSQAIW